MVWTLKGAHLFHLSVWLWRRSALLLKRAAPFAPATGGVKEKSNL